MLTAHPHLNPNLTISSHSIHPATMLNVGTSGKKTRGKQKIVMKKMVKLSHLQVTFSKRRSGLLKKASELCTLCGAQVALIIFSPNGKVFSFGHPSVEAIIQHYLNQAPNQASNTMLFIGDHQRGNVRDLNARLSYINNIFDTEKMHGEELKRLLKAAQAQFGWVFRVEEMDRPQLEKVKTELEDLKEHVTRYVVTATNPTSHQFFNVVGDPTNAMVLANHPPPLQVFPPQFIEGSMLYAHNLFGLNNMGGNGGPHSFL